MPDVRNAVAADLPALTAIYNHYIVHTPITFDVATYEPEQRRQWFDEHKAAGRHRLLVADDRGDVVGYATTSRWRPKAAYGTTVESSVYVRHDAVGRGIGRQLYDALFVRPDHWRRGIAAELLAAAEDAMRAEGYRWGRLFTPQDAPAERFYRAHGWVADGRLAWHHVLGFTVVGYAREL